MKTALALALCMVARADDLSDTFDALKRAEAATNAADATARGKAISAAIDYATSAPPIVIVKGLAISNGVVQISDEANTRPVRLLIEGLGLKEVGKVNSPTAEGYYLSDGHVNLAILKFKYDDPATTEGALRYTGLHHFGVEIENMEQARARIEKAGAVHRPYPGTEEMAKRGNVEVKFTGPDGVTIDLSEHGWLGTK